MSWAGACGLFDTVFITDVLSTYPASAFNWNIGFALTASPFLKDQKGTKKSSPQRTAFASLRFPRSGPAPWARRDGPSMAQHGSPGIHAGRPTAQNLLSASRRGGQIKSTARRGGRPAGLSRSVAADEPCEAASGCEATVKPESGIYLNDRSIRFYDCCVAVAHQTERSLRSSSATLYVGAKPFFVGFCDVCDAFCFCWSHTNVQTTRMPITEGRTQVLLWGVRGRTPRQPRWAMDGPTRLSRHPCRSTHYAEPALGLPKGRQIKNQCKNKINGPPRRPTGRPV